ncbi:mucin-21-like [Littorina saxatilis]|uniref:mucin-21-like n=1 Tax=Littorina saxatilis TaxID=31220 RepID=UPI0038B5D833
MSATNCAAPSVVMKVGYHAARRNALGDIFESLDISKLTLQCLPTHGAGKSTSTSTSTSKSSAMPCDSRRRPLTESVEETDGASEKAHFAGSCCTASLDTNANTRVSQRKVGAKNGSRSFMQQSHNMAGTKSTSLTHKRSAPCSSEVLNGSRMSSQLTSSTTNTNTSSLTNNKVSGPVHQNDCLCQSDCMHVVPEHQASTNTTCSNLQQQHNNYNSNSSNNTKSTSIVTTSSERKNSNKPLSRCGSLSSDQNESFSSSIAHLRAKDCAKRSIVC